MMHLSDDFRLEMGYSLGLVDRLFGAGFYRGRGWSARTQS
jgi:hypothetical protein